MGCGESGETYDEPVANQETAIGSLIFIREPLESAPTYVGGLGVPVNLPPTFNISYDFVTERFTSLLTFF